jgi:diguanylate cyclase (GGDEF)-like protein/PAS domain S-box-containing protein
MTKFGILVVEDEDVVAKDIESQLKSLDYDVSGIVSSGEGALELAKKLRPALVLMDVSIKGELDGFGAAEQIHRQLDIPVIFLSSNSHQEVLRRVKIASPSGYLTKPTNRNELQITIEMALHKHTLESHLRENEARWREAIEFANDLIFTLDSSGCFQSVNQAFTETLEYSAEELIGTDPIDLIVEEQRSEVADILDKFLNGHFVRDAEVDVLTKSGCRKSLEIRGRNAFDKDGNIIESIQIARDVTKRRRMERELNSSRESYRSLFDSVPIGLYRTNPDGEILDANPALVEMLGYQDINTFNAERAANLFVNPEDRECELELLKREGVVRDFELQLRRRDGSVIWVEDATQAIKDEFGQVICYEGSLEDVTERKLAEEALERRVQELAALYDTSLEINAQQDLNSLLLAIVARAATLIGVSKGALYLIRPDGKSLELVVGHNLGQEYSGTTLEIGEGLSGMIAQTGEPMMIEDYNSWHGRAVVYEQESFGRVLGVPLKRGDKVIGVINVLDDLNTGPFSEDDVRLVSLFADQTSIAVENVRLYEEAQHEISERKRAEEAEREQRNLAEALRDTAEALNSTLDFDEVLDYIITNVGDVVPYSRMTILLAEAGEAFVARTSGFEDRNEEEIVSAQKFIVLETLTLRSMADTGEPFIIQDTKNFEGWKVLPGSAWVRSYVGTPIIVDGQPVGFINLNSETAHSFTPADGERLKAFADQAAIAIKNARLYGETERYARNMAQLNEITRAALSAPDLQTMLQTLADLLGEMFKADHAHITLWEEQLKVTIPVAAYGPMRDIYADLVFEPGELTLTESILNAGEPLIIDGNDSPYYSPRVGGIYPAESKLGFPLIANGKKLGAVIIRYDQLHHFSQEEIMLGNQAAGQIALAISRLQSLESEQQRTAELTRANSLIMALGHVASRIEIAPDPDGVMKTMGTELNRLGVHSLAALFIPGSLDLAIHYLSFEPKSISLVERLVKISMSNYRLTPDRFYFYPEVIADRRPVFTTEPILNVAAMLPLLPDGIIRQVASLIEVKNGTKGICLPLIADEKVLGTLWMWGENLEESDLPAASVFATQVAIALENARLYTITQQLAITDDLTGFYNRRGLFELGRREVERALRFNHMLAAIMLDIDHFKGINDAHGHSVGDEVLQRLADSWRETLRGIDIMGRYGGEEFLVLLPETNLSTARQVAERMRERVDNIPLTTTAGPVSITISLGVATLMGEIMSLEELIADADKALYEAKETGRNRVAILGER